MNTYTVSIEGLRDQTIKADHYADNGPWTEFYRAGDDGVRLIVAKFSTARLVSIVHEGE